MIKILFVDFSRTLVEGSGCNSGGEFMGRGEEYQDLYPKFVAGKIPMSEVLTKTLADWKGLKVSDLPKIVKRFRFANNADTALKEIKDMGIKLALLSNIPTHLGKLIGEKYEFDIISGNVLEVDKEVFTGRILELHTEKIPDAHRILKEVGIQTNEAAMIGDRVDDAKVFEILKYGISYNGDETANRIAKYQVKDWLEVPEIIKTDL